MRVPASLMLSTQTARAPSSPVAGLVSSNPVFQLAPSLTLAVHLLAEALSPSSFFLPYIRALPLSFSIPLFFTPAQLLAIRPSPVFFRAVKLLRNHVRHYCRIHALLPRRAHAGLPRQAFAYSSFTWAVAAVMTRQNRVPLGPGGTALALVPLWDLCNHAPGDAAAVTTGFDPGAGALECFAMKRFQPGDMITIFYGPRPNSELFLFSGFVSDRNQSDEVALVVPLALSDNRALVRLKLRMLADKGVKIEGDGRSSYYTARIKGGDVSETMCVARVWMAEKEDLPALMRSNQLPGGAEVAHVEKKALELIRSTLDSALEGYRERRAVEVAAAECTSHSGDSTAELISRLHNSEQTILKNALQVVESALHIR